MVAAPRGGSSPLPGPVSALACLRSAADGEATKGALRCGLERLACDDACAHTPSPQAVSALCLASDCTPGATPSAQSSAAPTPRSSLAGRADSAAGSAAGSGPPSTSGAEQQPQQPLGAGRRHPSQHVDAAFVIARLRAGPELTGQVVAWGWEHAARLAQGRRALPAELFSTLWVSTDACLMKCTPQDVLEILAAWLDLLRVCPRHFRLAQAEVVALSTFTLPAAVKRMGEKELGALAGVCREIALHRSDDLGLVAAPGQKGRYGPSARDLLQPVYALAAAEAAWRCSAAARYVSPATLGALLGAGSAWSWAPARRRDPPPLAALKASTEAALAILAAHAAALPQS